MQSSLFRIPPFRGRVLFWCSASAASVALRCWLCSAWVIDVPATQVCCERWPIVRFAGGLKCQNCVFGDSIVVQMS